MTVKTDIRNAALWAVSDTAQRAALRSIKVVLIALTVAITAESL